MKPDWKDAPEWALFLSRDLDGEWVWREFRPKPFGDVWDSEGRVQSAGWTRWYETLEARPNA